MLIAAGASVHNGNNDSSPLMIAAEKSHLSVARELVKAGAEVNKVRARDDLTPLFVACFRDHLDLARELLAAGANVNAADEARPASNLTPLMAAVIGRNANLELVQLLACHGANLNAVDSQGDTAAGIAGEEGNRGIYAW